MSWHFRESVPTHVNNRNGDTIQNGDTINQPQACHQHSQIYWDQNVYPTYRLLYIGLWLFREIETTNVNFKAGFGS